MSDLPAPVRERLARNGFAVVQNDRVLESREEFLLDLATKLGEPCGTRNLKSLIDHLRPATVKNARPRSMSALHGKGQFPWHSDGAHWPVPPQYILLVCVSGLPGCASTDVSPIEDFLAFGSGATDELFAVRNGRRSFYSPILSGSRPYIRHDPCCMTPLTEEGGRLQTAVAECAEQQFSRIQWTPGTVAIINNWRCLHRRGAGSDEDCDQRHLVRITVMNRT